MKKTYVVLTITAMLIVSFAVIMVLYNSQKEKNADDIVDVITTEVSDKNSGYSESVVGEKLIEEGQFLGSLPGNIRPVILVNGTKYYWMGRPSLIEGANSPNWKVNTWTRGDYLPENYTEYGSLKEISKEEPTEDCQMKAAFSASGTIYTSEVTPEAVYVRMTSDWTEEAYFRFISDKLDRGSCVKWDGKYYLVRPDKCENIPRVPESCVSIGTMNYVGIDVVPENDLETNCPSDGNYALEGREVFFDADAPGFIYYEKHINDRLYVFKCPSMKWDDSETQSTLEPTAVPGEDYVFIADVIEIDGAYYHFRDLGEDSVATKEEEETILPQLEYLGRTTRVDWTYPKKELEANCLPKGTEVYYHAEADKFAFFWDDKPYHWWYTGKYCVCDKDEMVPGKYYSFSEYGDDVLYSLGWIEDVYEYNTKILGYILEMKDGSLVVQGVTDEEKASYECLQTDKYTQYEEDMRLYRKSHVSGEEDIELTVPHYIYVKNNKVSAIIPANTQN